MAKVILATKKAGLNLLEKVWGCFWHDKLNYEIIASFGSLFFMLFIFWMACNMIQ